MTNFLTRLVDRARGVAPRVEPIVAPRFAPAAVETIEVEQPRRAMPASARPAPPSRTVIKDRSRPTERVEKQDTKIEIVPEFLLVPEIHEREKQVIIERSQVERETAAPAHVGKTSRVVPAKPPTRRAHRGTPPLRALMQEDRTVRFSDEPRHEAPIVRVSIGRIEVRAAPAPAPPPRKAVRAAPPALSLDAYLQSRKDGGR